MIRITAYTDGSATTFYPFKGGFGIYIKTKNKSYKIRKGYCNTKTGRMEIMAVITCLKSIKNKSTKVIIYSDSMYVVNTCNTWIFSWEKRMWTDLKNVDLLKQLLIELREFKNQPLLKHIKGHQEVTNIHQQGNNIADELASYKTQKSWEVDQPIDNFSEFEKEDFKEINNKLYYHESYS